MIFNYRTCSITLLELTIVVMAEACFCVCSTTNDVASYYNNDVHTEEVNFMSHNKLSTTKCFEQLRRTQELEIYIMVKIALQYTQVKLHPHD